MFAVSSVVEEVISRLFSTDYSERVSISITNDTLFPVTSAAIIIEVTSNKIKLGPKNSHTKIKCPYHRELSLQRCSVTLKFESFR